MRSGEGDLECKEWHIEEAAACFVIWMTKAAERAPIMKGQQNLYLSLCKVKPVKAPAVVWGRAGVMAGLCFGTDSKCIIQRWPGHYVLPTPLIPPLHLTLGSDLSLAEEQLCHRRVRQGGSHKSWVEGESRWWSGTGETRWQGKWGRRRERKERERGHWHFCQEGRGWESRVSGRVRRIFFFFFFWWKFRCQTGRLPGAYSRKIYLTSASQGDKRVDWQRAESRFWSYVLTRDSSSCLFSLNRSTLPIQTKVTDQSTAPLGWCTTPQAKRAFTHIHTHPTDT